MCSRTNYFEVIQLKAFVRLIREYYYILFALRNFHKRFEAILSIKFCSNQILIWHDQNGRFYYCFNLFKYLYYTIRYKLLELYLRKRVIIGCVSYLL